MRKVLAAATVALLATSLFAPASSATTTREVTKEYTMANGMVIYESAHATWSLGTAWKVFRPKDGERFVSFSISDNTDQPVLGHIHIKPNRDGETKHIDFCNETLKPIRLGATKKIDVAVFMGTCPDGTPSVVTHGTITATFSR